MFLIISDKNTQAPEGYRKLSSEEIMNNYLSMDINKNFVVSKNEWMLTFIKLLEKDIDLLESKGPDSIIGKIQELSDEFDRYDTDCNKYLDYEEYKAILSNNIYISE